MAFGPEKQWKSCLGLFLAPTVAAVCFALLFWLLGALERGSSAATGSSAADVIGGLLGFALLAALFGAYPATLLIGIPLLLMLSWMRVRATPASTMLVGAIVAAVPALTWLHPWSQEWTSIASTIAIGAGAGLLFWAVAGAEMNQIWRGGA